MKISRRRIIAIVSILTLAAWSHPQRTAAQGVFDLGPTDTTIFTPDSDTVIGHGHYDITHVEGVDIVTGENKYLNGEFDREDQTVRPTADGKPPVLVSYRHRYFNADGTLQYEDSLDARTRKAACRRYDSSGPDLRENTLGTVPADTYAGATQLMILVGRLRQGAPDVEFHSFNCLPGPHIVAIKATPLGHEVEWPMYPGKLVQLEMKPDLGRVLNTIVGPFLPRVYGWFDPSNAFNYVGGQFDRYYKGRHVLMVRTHDVNPVVQRPVPAPIAH